MSRSLCVLLAALSLIQGTPAIRRLQGSPQTADQRSAHDHGDRGSFNQTDAEPPALTGQDMPVVQLVPGHYPARRAAQVAQHYLNTQHGSPYRWLQVEKVLSATLEEVADKGMKYNVTFSVKDGVSEKSAGLCSAEVMFPANEVQSLPLQAPPSQAPPQVHCSCEDLLKTNTTVEEDALYQHLKSNASVLVDAQYIPDSFGYIAPEMRPIWHLGGAASSFVMLKESNENTLYNLAQLANVTQLESQNDTLLFQFHVLLHEMVSQEIISWKLQASWCPAEGVRVLSAEWQPKCHHCVVPPTNTTLATTPPS
ncbi:latexin isoform X2 [Anguilla anguilla]|uniref:latexin isoform X2 n=1 Tax=Anguilla anguilla TaxID=7936 RepID=UPI0015AA333F|nr:latexin isoform X2 [Anguilla anguilla]